MAADFVCPKCKTSLTSNSGDPLCQCCKKLYTNRDGYFDFLGDLQPYCADVKQENISQALSDIENLGFEAGLLKSFVVYPSLEDKAYAYSRADWLCHCIGENNFRCLDIASDLGIVSEMLSNHYHQVYSIEYATEKIEFQKKRYRYSKISNIIILRANPLELPFPDNYLDLVVCNNDFSDLLQTLNLGAEPYDIRIRFLAEIKRVLASGGCMYLGLENKFGLLGSPLMRILRKSAYAGTSPRAIRGIKNQEEKKYSKYQDDLLIGRKLIKEVGFKTKTFWVYPHHSSPVFSANIADSTALRGFIKYFGDRIATTKKLRLILSLIEVLNKSPLMFLAKLSAPSFLLYCYKDYICESHEDVLIGKAGFKSSVLCCRGHEVLYFLYDQSAMPAMVLHLRRYNFSHTPSRQFSDVTASNARIQNSDPWLQKWLPGRRLNPLRFEESRMALEWLISFQKGSSQSEAMTEKDILQESTSLREGLSTLPLFCSAQNYALVDAYEAYMISLDVSKTPEHGDFLNGNILLEPKSHKINVLDWEFFREKGNPFFDFGSFFLDSMQMPTLNDFGPNLEGTGSFSPIKCKLQTLMDSHFGFKSNLNILLAYTLLRLVTRLADEKTRKRRLIVDYNVIMEGYNKMLKILAHPGYSKI